MNQLRNDLQVILQVQQPGGGYNCEGFSGVATVFPAQVVLQAVASRTAELAELAAALRRTLMDLTPLSRAGQTPCQGGPIPDASFCHAHRVAGCQKVLVLVGDEKGDFPDHAVDAWLTGGDNYRVLPVFPADADLSSLEKRNAELAKINAAFWSRSITEIIPTVLSTAAVTSDDFRIFISYKRLDSLPLAHQLFGALTEAGFDVFMDRFSIEPAVNFQVRLTQEMADKSMLVLLESAQLAQSPWTQLEIAFAKKHELGLASILLPGGVRVRDVDPGARIERDAADWVKSTVGPGHELTPDALKKVVLALKEEHGKAMVRRRARIRDSMRGALALRGLAAWIGPDGLLECQSKGNHYAIWLTPRPPDVTDFHFTHGRLHPAPLGGPARKGVVVGPTASLEVLRQARTGWLADRCEFGCYDEDRITDLADQIKAGVL
jgi:hypothetical protein